MAEPTSIPRLKDEAAYRTEAIRARSLGMVGKWAIHPAQIAWALGVFTPPAAEVARARCDELGKALREWQRALAASAGDQEEAAVLTAGEVKVAPTHTLTADLTWPKGATDATIELSVSPVASRNARVKLAWHENLRVSAIWANGWSSFSSSCLASSSRFALT